MRNTTTPQNDEELTKQLKAKWIDPQAQDNNISKYGCFLSLLNKQSGETMLHKAALCKTINTSLEKDEGKASSLAKSILKSAIVQSDYLHVSSKTKNTALIQAIKSTHTHTAMTMIDLLKDSQLGNRDLLLESRILRLCCIQDDRGWTALHHAIMRTNDPVIDKILANDVDNQLYFQSSDCRLLSMFSNNLFSLALAFNNYVKHPCDGTMATFKLVYFSISKASGQSVGMQQTKAAEQQVYMGWGNLSAPLWRYVLRYAVKRDAHGEILRDTEGNPTPDMNLIDTISDILNAYLTVWGFPVDWNLIYKYSDVYSGTPHSLLRNAKSIAHIGAAGRAVTLTGMSETLLHNSRYIAKQKIAELTKLRQVKQNPEENTKELDELTHETDWIICHDKALYYIPKRTSPEDDRRCIKIKNTEKNAQDFIAVLRFIPLSDSQGILPDNIRKSISAIKPADKDAIHKLAEMQRGVRYSGTPDISRRLLKVLVPCPDDKEQPRSQSTRNANAGEIELGKMGGCNEGSSPGSWLLGYFPSDPYAVAAPTERLDLGGPSLDTVYGL